MKQFDVPLVYRSPLITAIKNFRKEKDKLKKDFTPTLLDFGPLKIYLARHFGFCYGVENAIEIAYKCIEENPGKRIFLLSEMIHNPQVNDDLIARGISFLQDTKGKQIIPYESLNTDDIVIIPAFGTTIDIEQKLETLGIPTQKYNTTCPFVEKVWKRSEAIAGKDYSIVVHGKPIHEETRATFSRSAAFAPTVVVNNMAETIELAKYITGEKSSSEFYTEFAGRFSNDFNIETDLKRIGVVNQTTQLATDTQAIADYLKQVVVSHFNLSAENVSSHFADNRDTLCYATLDNQTAMDGLLKQPAHLALVIGGYNSSNTSHLVELAESVLTTYFINTADNFNDSKIEHYNWRTKEYLKTANFLPTNNPTSILISSGASCPDALVQQVIEKLAAFYNCNLNTVSNQFV